MVNIKFYILDHGIIEADEAWLLTVPNPATVSNKNRPANWIKVPTLTFLIDHPQGKILFDSTCHPEGMKERWPEIIKEHFPWYFKEEELLPERLKKIGLTPFDIKTVIISHLHMDHAGNLELFRHADIYVHKVELEKALSSAYIDFGPTSIPYIRADFDISGLKFSPIIEDTTLFDGVEMITLEGHCPGILGLVLHLEKSGTIICPADAIYTRKNYGPPPICPGIIYDSLGFFRTVEKVKRLQKKYNAQIFYSHDMEQFQKEYKLAPKFYE